MKLKSNRDLASHDHERNTSRTRAHTIEHGAVLVQRDVQGVVHVFRVGDDVFLVRDLCQALSSDCTLDRRRRSWA